MTARALGSAPVLSTPDTHIFEDPTPAVDVSSLSRLSDEQLLLTYEIERTIREIKERRWKNIALQFPDQMLVDASRVYEALRRGLKAARTQRHAPARRERPDGANNEEKVTADVENTVINEEHGKEETEERLFILADTSYGACCVDEIAAEHVDADVVVHYGRSCLSPPSRLPVIYVFTERPLDFDPLIGVFEETHPHKEERIILMADIPYAHHISALHARLQKSGYTNIFATSVVHNPSSLLPNRTVPSETSDSKNALRDYHLFYISEPPKSLLLTLSSRVSAIHIYPTDTTTSTPPSALLASTAMTLNRRYALLTSLTTASVFGILINTLSVKNYMHILAHVQRQITAAGKKYYTFVVGKLNAAKVANFSEVDGWVVIGCWESSLIESKEFWKPIITPFELGLALQADDERVWTGEWTGDFQAVLEEKEKEKEKAEPLNGVGEEHAQTNGDGEYDWEEESAPPEFDLRTGRYISHSRPMRSPAAPRDASRLENVVSASTSTALTKRANGDLAHVGGVVSPGAQFLREKRAWQGLGSDFANEEEGGLSSDAAKMEQGRSGIARGYVVGDDQGVH